MSGFAIRTQGLSKRYRIDRLRPSHAMHELLEGVVRTPFHRILTYIRPSHDRRHAQRLSRQYFWALKDVSFDVRQGEMVGIIGSNGAGKSALLKILARITKPTEGYAEIHGRLNAMLEVDTGFHPELTGRENIYLSGAIAGMKKAVIQRKFDEIVAFSEAEKFLDTPVKRYSSGMRVRLAFAIAAQLESEIMLLDEVLSVSDEAFQKRCLAMLRKRASEGQTILIVSHNMKTIQSFCSRAILLGDGKIISDGATNKVAAHNLANRRSSTS